MRVLLLVNKIYKTENKHLLGIYAVVNQVTLRLKYMIHMFVTKGDLVSIFWGVWVSQTPQMCSSSLNWPKNEKEKKWKKDRKQRERQRERNKIFWR